MRLLAVLSATALLIGGCGTPMYELTEDEETLITQYAAYAVGKYNSLRKKNPQRVNNKVQKTKRIRSIRIRNRTVPILM